MKLAIHIRHKSTLLLTFILCLLSASLASQVAASELVGKLISELGVSQKQAEGGAGSLLNLAGSNLSATDFTSLKSAIPSASSLIAAAPLVTGQTGTGLSMGSLGALAGINQQFESLGLGSDMVSKFGAVIFDYLKGSSGGGIAGLFESALPSGILGSAVPALKLLN